MWFFGGYQYLRDYDSQPGTDPKQPRTYEQNKIFAKLTWQLAPGWQLVQSAHDEFWVSPEQPTVAKPFDATLRMHASVPAISFGNLTHTVSANTVWDVRVGRFVYSREDDPSTGDTSIPSRFDRATSVFSGAPCRRSGADADPHDRQGDPEPLPARTVGAPIISERIGGQVERGESRGPSVIPTGVRFVDDGGRRFRLSRAIRPTPAVCSSRLPRSQATASRWGTG